MQITHLFKDVLHGQGRFVMLVNVSQAVQEFNETKRVLQVGALPCLCNASTIVCTALRDSIWGSIDPYYKPCTCWLVDMYMTSVARSMLHWHQRLP